MGSLGTDGLKTEEQKEKAGQRKVNRGGTMGLGEDTSKALKLEVGVETLDIKTPGDGVPNNVGANVYTGSMTTLNAGYSYLTRLTREDDLNGEEPPFQTYLRVDAEAGMGFGSLQNGAAIEAFNAKFYSGLQAETALAENLFLSAGAGTGFFIDNLKSDSFLVDTDNIYVNTQTGDISYGTPEDLSYSVGGLFGQFNAAVGVKGFPSEQNTTSFEGFTQFALDKQVGSIYGMNLTVENIWDGFNLSAGFNRASYTPFGKVDAPVLDVKETEFNVRATYKL